MSAVFIGGMDRLKRSYIDAAKSLGIVLKVFSGQERSIEKQLGETELVILCTGKVSHSARREALKYASAKNIPVLITRSAGVSALCCCIKNCPFWERCAAKTGPR